jgi:hypothetical protein
MWVMPLWLRSASVSSGLVEFTIRNVAESPSRFSQFWVPIPRSPP